MASEQAAGCTKEIGPLADVYALGAILYNLLSQICDQRSARLMRAHEARAGRAKEIRSVANFKMNSVVRGLKYGR